MPEKILHSSCVASKYILKTINPAKSCQSNKEKNSKNKPQWNNKRRKELQENLTRTILSWWNIV